MTRRWLGQIGSPWLCLSFSICKGGVKTDNLDSSKGFPRQLLPKSRENWPLVFLLGSVVPKQLWDWDWDCPACSTSPRIP
jgi:hypothetical protein